MAAELALDAVIGSPVGRLGIQMRGRSLSGIVFLARQQSLIEPDGEPVCGVLRALRAYFDDPSQTPDLPLQLWGTHFQQRVWQELRAIPVGQVLTYGALAERLASSPRAVGNACRRNPVPIVVPCHRVVARDGLGGFAGDSGGPLVAIKQWLLEHEGVEIPDRHPHIDAQSDNDRPKLRLLLA